MNLTKCELCQQQISPLAAACPSCGHPLPTPKRQWWQVLSMQVPSLFYGVVFLVAGLLGLGAGFQAFSTLATAEVVTHQIFGALMAIFAAICCLIAMTAAIAADAKS